MKIISRITSRLCNDDDDDGDYNDDDDDDDYNDDDDDDDYNDDDDVDEWHLSVWNHEYC